ncbi:MAG: hypothetical protein NTAFB01_06400 [Nitrospira sp.]
MSNSYGPVFGSLQSSIVLVLIVSLLVGCGGGDGSTTNSAPPTGTATLQPSVAMIPSTKSQYISSETDTTWTLRASSDVRAGDVLLLEDAAVKVTAVNQINGQTVLTVEQAEVEDVFSSLSIKKHFDLNDAEFIPAPGSQIPATVTPESATSDTAAPITGSFVRTLQIPYNVSPFSAALSFTIRGDVAVDFDAGSNRGVTGTLDVTGILNGAISMSTDKEVSVALPEQLVGRVRIPIRIQIGRLPVPVGTIEIPVSVGAEATAKFAVGVDLKGSVQSSVQTTFTGRNGFSVVTPDPIAGLTLTGTPSSTVPSTAVSGSLKAGPYVHAIPHLVFLGGLSNIGTDVKVGFYGHGQMKSIPNFPYYCLNLQAAAEGKFFGFARIVGGSRVISRTLGHTVDVGPPFTYPGGGCSGSVQFDAPTYSANLSAGSATITVVRTGDTSTAGSVHYATSDGTALAGLDYTATSGDLAFNPNETSKTLNVPFLNKLTSFGGTVNLTLSQSTNGLLLGTPNTAILTITRTTVQFNNSTYSVPSTVGSAVITVIRTGDTSKASTVQYATSDGTAIAGQHYTATSGILTFSSGETVKTFSVPIPTTPSNFTGTVNLTLSQASGAVLGAQSTATLNITGTSAHNWNGTWVGSGTGGCDQPIFIVIAYRVSGASGDSGSLSFTIIPPSDPVHNVVGATFTMLYEGNIARLANPSNPQTNTLNGDTMTESYPPSCWTATLTRQ